MKKNLTLLLVAFSILTVKPAFAYVYNVSGVTSQIIVDKKVKGTGIADYQDNISASQKTFGVGDTIYFELTVKNTGDKDLNEVKVTDTLPSYLNIVSSSPQISINVAAKNQLTWQLARLNSGDSYQFYITTTINTAAGQCLTNQAEVKANTGKSDADTASFCLQGVTTTGSSLPKNGPDSLILFGTLISAVGALGGFGLRKFARGY